jgi:hypothetical protein
MAFRDGSIGAAPHLLREGESCTTWPTGDSVRSSG